MVKYEAFTRTENGKLIWGVTGLVNQAYGVFTIEVLKIITLYCFNYTYYL